MYISIKCCDSHSAYRMVNKKKSLFKCFNFYLLFIPKILLSTYQYQAFYNVLRKQWWTKQTNVCSQCALLWCTLIIKENIWISGLFSLLKLTSLFSCYWQCILLCLLEVSFILPPTFQLPESLQIMQGWHSPKSWLPVSVQIL